MIFYVTVDLRVVPRFRQTSFSACHPLHFQKSCRLHLQILVDNFAFACIQGLGLFSVSRRSFPAIIDVENDEVRFRYNLPNR